MINTNANVATNEMVMKITMNVFSACPLNVYLGREMLSFVAMLDMNSKYNPTNHGLSNPSVKMG